MEAAIPGTTVKPVSADNEPAWKVRFRVPIIRSAQVAAGAPERGLVTCNASGAFQLHAWDVSTGRLRTLTNRPTGIMAGLLSPDGGSVYYHDDAGGNELGHFVRIPFDGGAPVSITPDMPPYPTFGLGISSEGNRLGFITADSDGYHLYVIEVGEGGALGPPQRIHSSARFLIGPVFSHNGAMAVVAASTDARSLQFGLVALDTASGRIIEELTDGEGRLGAVAFAPVPGDGRLLAYSNRTGIGRPVILDVVRGTRTEIALDRLEGEVYPADWSADGRQVLLIHFVRAVQRLLVYDVAAKTLTPLNHPGGTYSHAYFAPDGAIHVVREDSTHPPQVVVVDAATGMPLQTLLPASGIPPCRPWRSVSFASTDQQQIQGWLALPDGAGPFPTILHVHGGPEAAMTEVFLPSSQSWLDHGLAFLSINYRGSTTFGRAFLEQIWGNLGRWEVEDMVAARAWLVKEGIADPARVFVTGWSYGGFLTLLALGTRPDLWAGGMAGIAIADWAIAHEDTTDTLRGWRAVRIGGTPEEVPERYAASSPITYVEHVKAPVMIIQGRNDTRTPPRSVEAYEAKMKALGKTIEVHWFDAGHGSLVVDQTIDHHELMLQFARRVLGVSESRLNA
jgi:dienelactone hydrolase/Tol biopolymer transport system component